MQVKMGEKITMNRKTAAVLIPTVLFFSQTTGQVQPRRLVSDKIGGAGTSYETWKAKDDKAAQLAFPITLIFPYSPKTTFYAATSPATASLDAGENYRLGGLSDLRLGGHVLTLEDRLLLTFGLSLPTGKNALDAGEYPVAGVLAMPAFNFRVPTLGQGLDIQIGASTARQIKDWVFGLGASFLSKGGFKPFKGVDEEYNPGSELTVTAGADRKAFLLGREMQIQGDLVYTTYFEDTWGGEKVFKSGGRFLIQAMSSFKCGSVDAGVFIRERVKGRNKRGSGSLYDTERKNSNANQFEIQGWGWYPVKKDFRLKGLCEIKLYSDSDYGTGGATLFGFGGGGQYRISPKMLLAGDVRFYVGAIKSGTEKVGTTGLKLFGGVEYTL
jgi:hypothetical protein